MKTSIRVLTALCVCLVATASGIVVAEESAGNWVPFGKEHGSIYLGGTSGLSGRDYMRGYTDSLFYAKWAAQQFVEFVGEPQGVIYGDDDREDIYTITDQNILSIAQATVIVAFGYEVSDNGNGTYDLTASPWTTQGGLPLCEGERFAGQLTMGNCSGFLVGEDLIVTAGHCLSTCGDWAFVFGFQQIDETTPSALTIPEDDVYFCSEVIAWAYEGDDDYCLIRTDRPVVGHTPLPIRRSGAVADGDPVMVVGHPTGLPMKAAGGAEVKNNQGALPWFQANTDSYGGNSGSVVVNSDTWLVEGILVRGAPDFVYTTCVASNVVPNTGNPSSGLEFEEISKIGSIAHLIPELVNSTGEIALDRTSYNCDDVVGVELRDLDLEGLASYDLLLFSTAADSELVNLSQTPPGTGLFEGTIATISGSVAKYDGLLQVSNGDQIDAIYEDADDGTGTPATVQAVAQVDCQAASISGVIVIEVQATSATITFETDEAATGTVHVGPSCGDYVQSRVGASTISHQITVDGLTPNEPYWFIVEVADGANNITTDDNGGSCYSFTTPDAPDYFTELFSAGCDLVGRTLHLQPDGSPEGYQVCQYDNTSAWVAPGTGLYSSVLVLSDDSYQEVTAAGGNQFSIHGNDYASVFVGSNGFITYGAGSSDWSETLEEHFDTPPRLSVFWDDLDPAQGGQVIYDQFENYVTISWDGVPEHNGTNTQTMQVQLYFSGDLVFCYQAVESEDGIVGISDGTGMPADFVVSDLSEYSPCEMITCYADTDSDGFGDQDDAGHSESGPVCQAGNSGNNLDCDDTRASVYPSAPEVADDGIDQDCDGFDDVTCFADSDDDGYGDASNPAVFTEICGSGYVIDATDNCPVTFNAGQLDDEDDGVGNLCDNCPDHVNPGQEDSDLDGTGDACETCCIGEQRGDVNLSSTDPPDLPTIGDISAMIDAKFISSTCGPKPGETEDIITCLDEADVNATAVGETTCDDVTIGDISLLIDYLFITGPTNWDASKLDDFNGYFISGEGKLRPCP